MIKTLLSRSLLVVIACLLSCLGCQDLGKELSASGPLVPLTPGNSWHYLVHASGSSRTDSATVTIEKESTIKRAGISHPFAVWRKGFPGSPDPYGILYWNDAKGLQQVGLSGPGGDTLLTLALARKCPVAEGESWEVPIVQLDSAQKLYVARTRRVNCAGINVPLQTPAGVFSCILYHWRERPADDILMEWDYYEWWAPGVGFVARRDQSASGGGPVFTTTLYKYELTGGHPSQ